MKLKTIHCPVCGYKMQFSKPKKKLHFIKDYDGIISTRLFRGLVKLGDDVKTLEDLSEFTSRDILRIPNLGRTSLREARKLLSTIGLDLRDYKHYKQYPDQEGLIC